MTPTYVTGYDGTDASRAAVRFAMRLAATRHADVHAVHVHAPVVPAFAPGALPMADAEMEAAGQEAAEAVLAGLDEPGVMKRLVRSESPAQGLQAVAEEEGASLICVGTTHRGAVGRLVAGSVASHLLHGATCAVAAVPGDTADAPIDVVGVAYDGRPESEDALRVAADVARELGARLVILQAYEPAALAAPALAADATLEPALRRDAERSLRDAAAGLADLDVETQLLAPPAGRTIVCASLGLRLLVTGSRGYGPVRSVLLGSVSRYLVDHAHCPVLVVPRSAATGARTAGAVVMQPA